MPTDRAIRLRGALLAAGISSIWLAASTAIWLMPTRVSGIHDWAGLAAIGALAALPASTLLGWQRAIESVRGRGEATNMTVGVMVLVDFEVAIAYGLAAAVLVITQSAVPPIDFMPRITEGVLTAVGLTALALIVGTLVFSLPGLAMAIPSAWLWQRLMLRMFSSPAPAGGGRGSADPRR